MPSRSVDYVTFYERKYSMNTNTIRIGADLGVETSRARPRISDFSGLLTWAKGRVAAVDRVRQRRRAISELVRMSDARLADLGIPRGQIPEVVDGLIAREGPGI
jgi:uncharacterized protein YjiS (DUF1127 family)